MSDDSQQSDLNSLESMVRKMFRYQQRQKYWQIAKFIFLTVLTLAIGLTIMKQVNQSLMPSKRATSTKLTERAHISLVELRGPITGSFETNTPSTVDFLLPALRRAFKSPHTVAVVLRINSPGGSAVQSDEIYQEILYLRKKYPKIPIYASCEELCASAGYYIASACNFIYANPSSLVGSIGVVGAFFGYDELMKKIGVERRLIATGDQKAMLDPYSPLNKEDVEIVKTIQKEMLQTFTDAVKQGRGERLKVTSQNEKELFSGRAWVGTQALQLGLIDQLGSIDTIARELKVGIVNYTPQPDLMMQFKKITGMGMSTMLNSSLFASHCINPSILNTVTSL